MDSEQHNVRGHILVYGTVTDLRGVRGNLRARGIERREQLIYPFQVPVHFPQQLCLSLLCVALADCVGVAR